MIKKMKKKRKNISKKEHVLWGLIFLLCILQGLSIWQIMKLQKPIDYSPDLSMRFMLKSAEEERYKYPIIDISENRVYIPEARIYLPLNEASRNLRYDFRVKGDGYESSVLYISTSSVVGQQSGPQYESCDKVVTLTSVQTPQIINSSKVGLIQPTKDDMSAIYAHSTDACWNGNWYSDLRDGLVSALKESKNY